MQPVFSVQCSVFSVQCWEEDTQLASNAVVLWSLALYYTVLSLVFVFAINL